MVLTYENVAFERVVQGVERLLETEFGSSVVVQRASQFKGLGRKSKGIRIWPLGAIGVSRLAGAVADDYVIAIVVTVEKTRSVGHDQERLKLAARVKRVLENNTQYSTGGNYQWHSGKVETQDFEWTSDNEDENALRPIYMEFQVTVMEMGL